MIEFLASPAGMIAGGLAGTIVGLALLPFMFRLMDRWFARRAQ